MTTINNNLGTQYNQITQGLTSTPVGPHLPDWIPIAGRNDINETATEPQRRYATVSPEGTILPIVYGEDYVGPIISLVHANGGYLYLRCVWCLGEVEQVVKVISQEGDLPAGTLMNHYTGTTTQGVDPLLAAAIQGYADTCIVEVNGEKVGVCYSVVAIPSGSSQGFPRLMARIKGKRVRDPRGGNWYAATEIDGDFNQFTTPRLQIGYNGTAHKYGTSANNRGTCAAAFVGSDQSKGTITMVLRRNGGSLSSTIVDIGNSKFRVYFDSDGTLRVTGKNSSSTTVVDAKTTAAIATTGTTGNAVVIAFDLSVPAVKIYVDGQDKTAGSPTLLSGQTVNVSAVGWAIGGDYASATTYPTAELSGLSISFGTYVDPSIPANNSAFFDPKGRLLQQTYTTNLVAWDGWVVATSFSYGAAPSTLVDFGSTWRQLSGIFSKSCYYYQGVNGGLYAFWDGTGTPVGLKPNGALTNIGSNLHTRLYAKISDVSGSGPLVFEAGSGNELFRLSSSLKEDVVEHVSPAIGLYTIKFDTTAVSAVLRQYYLFPAPRTWESNFEDIANDILSPGAGWDENDSSTVSEADSVRHGLYSPLADIAWTAEDPICHPGETVSWYIEIDGTFTGEGVKLYLSGGGTLVGTFTQPGAYSGTAVSTNGIPRIVVDCTTGNAIVWKVKVVANTIYRRYTATPSLFLADLIESTQYGLGGDVNDEGLLAAVTYNEELIGTTSEKRHQAGITLATQNDVMSWIESIRAYARCFITVRDGEYLFIPDKPGSSVASITKSNVVQGTMKLTKKSLLNHPNVVKVYYTSTAQEPWVEDFVEVVSAAVLSGQEFRRPSEIRMSGVQSKSMAHRYAVERLNYSSLLDLEGSFQTTDANFKFEIGDIITVTHPLGLTSKLVRVTGCDVVGKAILSVSFIEYDANVYSDAIISEPPPPDYGGQTPFNPPPITGVTITESFFTTGLSTKSQLQIAWNNPTYAFTQFYSLELYENGVKIVSTRVSDLNYFFRDVVVGASYNAIVRVVSTAYVAGLPGSATYVALGYTIPPDFSAGQIVAYEAGDAINAYVRQPAIDVDLWGYEWRYREACTNNLWPKGGVLFSSSDWTGNVSNFTFASRSLIVNKTIGTKSIHASSAGGTLTNGRAYDVYVKVKAFDNQGGTGGVCVAPFGSTATIGGDGTNLWLGTSSGNNRPGLYVLRNFVVNTAADFYIVKYDGDLGVSACEIEYIAFREPQDNCETDWGTATFFERAPATNVRFGQLVGGTYIVYCKALDGVRSQKNPYGQYSSQTKQANATVVSDASSFFRVEFVPGIATQTQTLFAKAQQPSASEFDFLTAAGSRESTGFMVTTGSGRTWNSAFSGTVNSYTGPIFNNFENSSGTHKFLHDAVDVGSIINGSLQYYFTIIVTGTTLPTYKLYYWNNPGDTPSSKDVTSLTNPIDFAGRFFYMEITVPSGAKVSIARNSQQRVEVSALPRTETGTATTNGPDGSGDPDPITVTLVNSYSRATSVRAWSPSTNPLDVYVDNITLGPVTTFTIVAVNLRGEPVAANVQWEFKGV